MNLSKNTIEILVDLIENKLSMMEMGDREELREITMLERSLKELHALANETYAEPKTEHRGRRRKLSSLVKEYEGAHARSA